MINKYASFAQSRFTQSVFRGGFLYVIAANCFKCPTNWFQFPLLWKTRAWYFGGKSDRLRRLSSLSAALTRSRVISSTTAGFVEPFVPAAAETQAITTSSWTLAPVASAVSVTEAVAQYDRL